MLFETKSADFVLIVLSKKHSKSVQNKIGRFTSVSYQTKSADFVLSCRDKAGFGKAARLQIFFGARVVRWGAVIRTAELSVVSHGSVVSTCSVFII